MLNIFIAILPALIFIIIFSLMDRDLIKKKWFTLFAIFVIGAIGAYVTYRFEMHFGSYFKKVKDSNYFEVLFYAIFGVAIFEEGYKWLLPTLLSIKDKTLSNLDIFIYSIFSSIGFALYENIIFYAIPYGLSNSISRMFTAFPSHICFAIFMGYFLSLSRKHTGIKKILFIILSLIIPIIIHALYNSFLYNKELNLIIYYQIYYILLLITSLLIVYRIKKNNKNVGDRND